MYSAGCTIHTGGLSKGKGCGVGGVLGGWVGYLCKKERSEFGRERDKIKKNKKKRKNS